MELLPCYICDHKSVFYCTNISTLKSKESKTPICDYFKKILNNKLPKRFSSALIQENTAVCLECLNKIDEYDSACLTVKRVEQELREIILHTESRYLDATETKVTITKGAIEDVEQCKAADIDVIECDSDSNFMFLSDEDTDLPFHSKDSERKVVSTRSNLDTPDRNKDLITHKCPICLKTFSDKNHLVIHRRKHSKVINGKESTAPTPIESKAKVVVKEPTTSSCTKCPAEFSTKDELAAHLKFHIMPGNRCPLCGIYSKDDVEANEHMELHQNIPSTQCVICHRDYPRRAALTHHMRIHTRSALFQCEKCGKGFIHRTSFEAHIMAHEDLRDKICPHCPRKFRSSSHLIRHMRIHTGDKPYSCPDCGKKFAQRYNMTVHHRLHSTSEEINPDKNHICTICSAAFARATKLSEHYQKVHEIMIPHTFINNQLDSSNEVKNRQKKEN